MFQKLGIQLIIIIIVETAKILLNDDNPLEVSDKAQTDTQNDA